MSRKKPNKNFILTDAWGNGYLNPEHYVHTRKPFEGHYPNKNEAKLLRRIMSESGLSEKEVRAIKKYRILLAKAGRKKGTKDRFERWGLKQLKYITSNLKLPKEHPLVKEEYKKLYKGIQESRPYFTYSVPTYEQVCRL